MEPPSTSDGEAVREKRLTDKLERSPGSFFKARARDLVLAAEYANSRLPSTAYSATSRRHHHTVCGATYAVLLSSFELTVKALYARIIDKTTLYDDALQSDSTPFSAELIIANREVAGAGDVFAARWNAWQRPADVNTRFRKLLVVDPIPNSAIQDLEELWQIRHVIAHSSGVTSRLDRHRLAGAVEADRALMIDGDYLELVEARLLEITKSVVSTVGTRLLDDFFAGGSRTWSTDMALFTDLALLGRVVGQTQDLPDVLEADFDAEAASRV